MRCFLAMGREGEPRIIRLHMMNEFNGQIISFRNLLNESNSIPGIILLNEWKEQRVTSHCLHSGPSHFVCGPSSLAFAKSFDWRNSFRRTANLRDRSSEIRKGKERKASEKKDKTVINVNDVTASLAIMVSRVSLVWSELWIQSSSWPSGSYIDKGKGGHKKKERKIFDICYAAGSISKGRQEKKELNTWRRRGSTLREGWERRETRDPKWLDWIKMAGVKQHLSILAWLYIHVKQDWSFCHD